LPVRSFSQTVEAYIMRARHLIHLALVVAIVSGSGCATMRKIFGRKPVSDPNAVIQPQLVDEGTGKALESATGAFEDTRERVTDISFEPVYFGYDSAQLAPVEVAKIEKVAQHLLQNGGQVLVVEGHCDERGSNEYNLSLGEQRASAIRTYLANLGVGGDRMQTRSFGEEKPASQGHDDSSWRLNRRGEFTAYR
jgi:peptidoglycan-associated lipoprotein